MDCSPPGSSILGDSPGKNTGVGCYSLLRGIFPPRDWTQVSHIAGWFFTVWATGDTLALAKFPLRISLEPSWPLTLRALFIPWLPLTVLSCLPNHHGGSGVTNPPAIQETCVPSLAQEDTVDKELATHSSILAWEIHGQRSLVSYSPWGHKSQTRLSD